MERVIVFTHATALHRSTVRQQCDMVDQHASDSPLPIRGTEYRLADDANALISESLIRQLVESFYGRVIRDEALGPIFDREVADWPVHLTKMCDFWSAVVLRTGRYAGRPLEAHKALEAIQPEHFDDWLQLWESVVQEVVPNSVQGQFIVPAQRMASHMRRRLFA